MDSAQMEKVAAGWTPKMTMRERAASIGIVARALTPAEWNFCAADCVEAREYLPSRWQSPAVERLEREWAERIAHFEQRAEMAQIRYDQAMADHAARALDSYRGAPLQNGAALIVAVPVSGDAARARSVLENAIADLADELAARDRAVLRQYAAESVTGPAAEPVRMSRGRRR